MGVIAVGDMERRFILGEVRVVSEGDEGLAHIQGYAAVFNQWSEDLGFREKIESGAFNKTLGEADIRGLFNHNPDMVLGRNRADTLSLLVDDHGLFYDATTPDVQWARDLLVSIKRGDVTGSSFGFDVIKDDWASDEDGIVKRRLIEVRLYDVGPVTFPAYPQTSSEARERLKSLLQIQATEPAGGGHSEDDEAGDGEARVRLEIARRRIEIAELEIGN